MEKINWDFGDYNTSKYPLDLNSIPWYPATFPAPIPKLLIGLLSIENQYKANPPKLCGVAPLSGIADS